MRPCSELTEKILEYDADADVALIEKAYEYGKDMHSAQVRASGEPYFSHPIEVSYFLTSLKLDTA